MLSGGGARGEEADGLRFGRELARWNAALQRAHAMLPEEEGRHHIRRVQLLTQRCSDGLLRQVGQKLISQRQAQITHQTPERTAFYPRTAAGLVTPTRPRAPSLSAQSWLALPSAHGGWLWRWEDGEARWLRLWCMLQGRALLCYAETYAAVDVAAAAAAAEAVVSPSSSAAAAPGRSSAASRPGGGEGVPDGVDLERPVLVLWPAGGRLSRSSDAVHAPSAYVFELHAASGRRHRLCANTAAQLTGWMSLLRMSDEAAPPQQPAAAAPAASPAAEVLGAPEEPPAIEAAAPPTPPPVPTPSAPPATAGAEVDGGAEIDGAAAVGDGAAPAPGDEAGGEAGGEAGDDLRAIFAPIPGSTSPASAPRPGVGLPEEQRALLMQRTAAAAAGVADRYQCSDAESDDEDDDVFFEAEACQDSERSEPGNGLGGADGAGPATPEWLRDSESPPPPGAQAAPQRRLNVKLW